MSKPPGNDLIRRMREALARIYTQRDTAGLLAHDAGLDLTHIDLSSAPAIFWQAIVEEAIRAGKVEALLVEAGRRAPAVDEFAALSDECRMLAAAGALLSAPAQRARRALRVRIVALAVLAVLVLAGATAVAYARSRAPVKMTAAFNVAVAEFGVTGPDDQPQSSALEQQAGGMVYDRLKEVLLSTSAAGNPGPSPDPSTVQIWHDSLGWLAKRTTLGIVGGDSPNERETAAAKLAFDVAADLVIYGNLEKTGRDADLWLRFYVPELAESRELLGEQQLGEPIRITDPGRLELGARYEITSRVEALAFIALGLNYELQSVPGMAVENFTRAAQTPGWSNNQGKEIAYFFLGRAQLRAGDHEPAAEDSEKFYEAADDAFETSLALSPNYARPRLGLGNVALARAQRLPADQLAARLALVDEAVAAYDLALAGAVDSPGEAIEVKARLDRCSAYQVAAQAEMEAGHHPEADAALGKLIAEGQLVIDALDRAGNSPKQLDELRAMMHYDLAVAYHQKGHLWCRQDPAHSRDLSASARSHLAYCVQFAETQAATSDSHILADLKDDCSIQEECTRQCFEALQGGQDACSKYVCLHDCDSIPPNNN